MQHLSVRLVCLLAGVLLVGGCASEPASTHARLHGEDRLSRDGVLHYRLPVGWFDVTADSQATGRAIWLVRNDYGASITVEQVYLMGRAEEELGEEPLLHLAQLTLPLVAGPRAATVKRAPELFRLGSRQYCGYALVTAERAEQMQVVLFDVGSRVYAVTFFGDGSPAATAGISAVQEPFLRALRW
jgi:hypothetical protein